MPDFLLKCSMVTLVQALDFPRFGKPPEIPEEEELDSEMEEVENTLGVLHEKQEVDAA